MRVLHVIPGIGPSYGGPSVAIRAMTEGLASAGIDVHVATSDADGPRSLDVPLDRPVREGAVTYQYFRRTLPGEWKLSLALTRWLWRHTASFDVVHVHALFSYATIPGCRVAAFAGVPYVLRPLGTLTNSSLAQHLWKKRPYLALIERAHLRKAAAIHATSQPEAAAIRALGFGDRVRVVPLGVAIDANARRPSPAASGGVTRLLFLSRLHPGKGIPLLFDALSALDPEGVGRFALTVAGDGDRQYRAELQRLAAERGLGARVDFVGHVTGDAKRQLLRESDLFVLPSSGESFGIAVAEALAAGLPVVVSDQVAIAREIAAADAGLIVPLDAPALATAIDRLISDPERRAGMGQNALRLARDRYSWERATRELIRLYDDVASDALPGARARASALAPRGA